MVNDVFVENLWKKFGDIPINEDDTIDEDFYIWKKGTDKLDIWHWFDDNHSLGLAKGLMYKYSWRIK